MAQKEFQKLDLKDVFLSVVVPEDAEICQLVLGLIMGKLAGLMPIWMGHNALFSKDFCYVRLSVRASGVTDMFYDVEMRNSHKEELPKRTRYHQAELDVTLPRPGGEFQELPTSYVIFIYTYDPFHSGLYRYMYGERCEETGEYLGDKTCRIYLSTKGASEADVPQELIRSLKYMETSTDGYVKVCKDERIRRLYQKAEVVKKSRRLGESYMVTKELLEDRAAGGK